jgi:Pyruvate/2-oxoacid:ferredoxin oxidoreductase gamma subunit
MQEEISKQVFAERTREVYIDEHYALSDQYTPRRLMEEYYDSLVSEIGSFSHVMGLYFREADVDYGENGAIVINSGADPEEIRPMLKGYKGRVCTIDANKISEEELGKVFPNTPMLAAIVKVSGVVDADEFVKDMEASFKHKFASKPQVIDGNMRALKRSMEEVKG